MPAKIDENDDKNAIGIDDMDKCMLKSDIDIMHPKKHENTVTQDLDDIDIDSIRRQYGQQVPIRSFNWGKLVDNSWKWTLENQELVLNVVLNPPFNTFPPHPSYQFKWFKCLTNLIERQGVEIHENLLNVFMESLSSSSVQSQPNTYKIYFLSHYEYIVMEEAVSKISNGTTGLATWEGSLRLMEYLLHLRTNSTSQSYILNDKNILELGSGCGLVGLACASLTSSSSKKLLLTDYNDQVLDLLQKNISVNNLTHRVTTQCLDWEQFSSFTESEKQTLADRADLIIGVDIVYDVSVLNALVTVLRGLLERNNKSVALLSLTKRNEKTFNAFLQELESMGLVWEAMKLDDVAKVFVHDEEVDNVVVMEVKLKS